MFWVCKHLNKASKTKQMADFSRSVSHFKSNMYLLLSKAGWPARMKVNTALIPIQIQFDTGLGEMITAAENAASPPADVAANGLRDVCLHCQTHLIQREEGRTGANFRCAQLWNVKYPLLLSNNHKSELLGDCWPANSHLHSVFTQH